MLQVHSIMLLAIRSQPTCAEINLRHVTASTKATNNKTDAEKQPISEHPRSGCGMVVCMCRISKLNFSTLRVGRLLRGDDDGVFNHRRFPSCENQRRTMVSEGFFGGIKLTYYSQRLIPE